MPVRAGIDAVRSPCAGRTGVPIAEMTGETGAGTTAMVAADGALMIVPSVSRHSSESVPGVPAVNVIVFVMPEVTPATPPGLVIVPPAIVHAYVIPGMAVTCATMPVRPAA